MKPALQGKTILVTGGTLGIGRVTVEACLRAGAKVFFCSRTRRDVKNTLVECRKLGRVGGGAFDISDEGDVKKLFAATKKTLGPLHGVIHCAGTLGPVGLISETSAREWQQTITNNLFGSFLVLREACRVLKRRGGRVVLFSGGGSATPFPRFTGYACSKVGVVRLCESVAIEMAPFGIAVNAIAPGFVATRFHQLTLKAGKRAGPYLDETRANLAKGGESPTKAADLAVFLMSEASYGISGRLISAVWDEYRRWPAKRKRIEGSDLFTLRRIVPKDRGENWQ